MTGRFGERSENPESSAGEARPARRAVRSRDVFAAPAERRPAALFFLLVGFALYLGWQARDEPHLSAESGLGYAFGIVGGVLMLAMLSYSLRKRVRWMQGWGPIRYWFQAHMVLGVLGPAFILFHAGFHLGSVNSNVALTAMLLVAGSGLVGRYLYTHIHYGLYGMRARLKGLREQTDIYRTTLEDGFGYAPALQGRLLGFESALLAPPRGILQRIVRLSIAGVWTRFTYVVLVLDLRRALNDAARGRDWDSSQRRKEGRAARRHILAHLTTVLKIARLEAYERLFALWHVFHLPVVVVLALTGLIHVLVVHAY